MKPRKYSLLKRKSTKETEPECPVCYGRGVVEIDAAAITEVLLRNSYEVEQVIGCATLTCPHCGGEGVNF